MDAQGIAQWLIDNPQEWFRLAELVAERKPFYARQLAEDFDLHAVNYHPVNRDDWVDEFQEWKDFDPDC